ncbi:MAG: hypothetical protein K8S62_05830 [Candidatus Sabulitectum sp.]|nr:hypothetical protein [Candidatus Sabulitectum sp.]
MKYSLETAWLFLFAVLSCGSNSPEAQENFSSTFIPPDDPGLSTYRTAQFSVDWQLTARDQVDWDTALHIPAIAVTTDENSRITETAGLWRGRPSDNVNVAGLAPLIRISYLDNTETITFHRADGEPHETNRFFGYRITRSEAGNSTVLEYLDEYGNTMVLQSGVARLQVENEGEGWYIRTQYDVENTPAPISPQSPIFRIRYLLDSQQNQLATENTNNSGESLPLYGEVYRIERSFNADGHLTEMKKLDENGEVVEDPNNPGWQIYQRSPTGLTTGFRMLGSNGEPFTDSYGTYSSEFEYDHYGRMTFMAWFDINGNPSAIGGVWANVTEFNDRHLITTASTLGSDSELMDVLGIAEKVFEKDSIGNNISVTYFNQNGEPARDQADVHQYRYIYGRHCRLLERQIWNSSNEPDTSTRGFHIERYLYDQDGNFLRTEYLDKTGEVFRN